MKLTVLKVEDFMELLLSRKLIHEGEVISSIRMDGLHTIIVERVLEEKRALLESRINKKNFSVRFNQAIRGDSSIKTIQDLLSKPIDELRKLSGFKNSCERELNDFRDQNDL